MMTTLMSATKPRVGMGLAAAALILSLAAPATAQEVSDPNLAPPGQAFGIPKAGARGAVASCVARRITGDYHAAKSGGLAASGKAAMEAVAALRGRYADGAGKLDESRLGDEIAEKITERAGGDGGLFGFKALKPDPGGMAVAGATMAKGLGKMLHLAEVNPTFATALGTALLACRG